MNEGGLLAWKLKTRQPRAEGMGVEWRWRQPEKIKRAAASSGRSRAHGPSPPPSSRGPTGCGCGRGSGARRASPSPPAATQQGRPALARTPRGRGGGPGGGVSPRAPFGPYDPSGDREEVKGGRRGGRRTHEPPPPPPASNLPSPSRPSPVTHCPRLTSWAASKQEGGGEHEQEKHKQAGEESHGATRPVSSPRPRMLSAAPAVMALLFIRAPGGAGRGGARTTHGHLSRPLLRPRKAVNVAAMSLCCGVRGRPGESRGQLPGPRDSRESPPPAFGWAGDVRFDACSALPVPLQLIGIINGYFI